MSTTSETEKRKTDFKVLAFVIVITAYISFNFGMIYNEFENIQKMSKVTVALEMCKAVIGSGTTEYKDENQSKLDGLFKDDDVKI